MKRLIAAAAVALILTGCALRQPLFSWVPIASQLSRSTFMLTDEQGEGFCSAFVIDSTNDYLMTAAHCIGDRVVGEAGEMVFAWEFFINDQKGLVEWVNYDLDAAVIRVPFDITAPALAPRLLLVPIGLPVAAYGYALEDGKGAHFRTGVVSEINNDSISFDQAGIGGMSGGPTVDQQGRVIAINQTSDRVKHFAGKTIRLVWAQTSQYWGI